jgi:hypothetical protein
MKRSRQRPRPRSALGVDADVATDTTATSVRPPRGNRYQRMKLPHERDESAHRVAPANPVATQGARDVEQGKTDTDCYTEAGPRFDSKQQR